MKYKMHKDYRKGYLRSRIGMKFLNKIPIAKLREFQNVSHAQQSNAIAVGGIKQLVCKSGEFEIALEAYLPVGKTFDCNEKFPILIYYHGGGFIFGQHNAIIGRQIAAVSGVVCVFVDYRLAPENQFPIPLEDCYSATKFVAEHAELVCGDSENINICGDSAGSSLAMGVVQLAAERKDYTINRQVLIYPMVDFYADVKNAPYQSYRDCGKKYFLTHDFITMSVKSYLGSTEDFQIHSFLP